MCLHIPPKNTSACYANSIRCVFIFTLKMTTSFILSNALKEHQKCTLVVCEVTRAVLQPFVIVT